MSRIDFVSTCNNDLLMISRIFNTTINLSGGKIAANVKNYNNSHDDSRCMSSSSRSSSSSDDDEDDIKRIRTNVTNI